LIEIKELKLKKLIQINPWDPLVDHYTQNHHSLQPCKFQPNL